MQRAAVGDGLDFIDQALDRLERAARDEVRHADGREEDEREDHEHRADEDARTQLGDGGGHAGHDARDVRRQRLVAARAEQQLPPNSESLTVTSAPSPSG